MTGITSIEKTASLATTLSGGARIVRLRGEKHDG
jgi:hypothetical protein